MKIVTPVRRSLRVLSAVMMTALIAGCSAAPVPTDTFYNLTAGRSGVSTAASPVNGTLEVPRFRAEGVVNERAIVYRSSATAQRQYNYHYWAEPPAVMFQRSFIDALRQARTFKTVAAPEVRADRDYELIGTLRRLEHVTGGGPAKVAVEFDIALRRARGGETMLLKSYTAERSASGGVPGAVESISAAVDQLISEVIGDIAAAQ